MNDLQSGSFRDYANAVLTPVKGDQFYCREHNYGWSIDSDGIDHGCHQCEGWCPEHESSKCEKCNMYHCCEGDPCDDRNPYLRY